jgi:hypothetical protein
MAHRRHREGRLALGSLAAIALAGALPFGAATGRPTGGISPAELFPGASFADGVPTQNAVLGFEHGARPLHHAEVLRYLETLAASSARARVLPYAESHEGRRLLVLAVGDEATVADLERFRREHLERMDPRGRPAERDREVLAGAKAVAWMAYGIHGDELSSVDAAVALAYWLVAGEDELARGIRRDLVVLIDPLENPDGRERFLAQTTSFAHATPSPDTEDLSHTTVWPWGRGNHYLFDLNRDWFSLVQPESARSAVIASWLPQLMVDSHEMGADSTYLFSPARHPFNPHLGPHVLAWWDRFAADQARALDARGYGYYTREWNEEFFPGYGSSWASYLGSVAILYEMSSTEGTLVRKREGVLRTYAQAVEHHVTSSVANLTTLLQGRHQLLLDTVTSRRDAVRRGAEGPVRVWIFPATGFYPDRTRALAELLARQGIEVLRLRSGPLEIHRLRDARTGKVETLRLEAGSTMVPLDQPAGNLVRVLLDPHTPMEAAFLREEREYLERGKGSRLYDTTAWSLPLCYGVEAYWADRKPEGAWEPLGASTHSRAPAVALPPAQRGAVFGYAFDGTPDGSAFALADLLERGLRVKVAEKAFRIGDRAFQPGTVLLEREGNPPDLADRLAEVAARWSVDVVPVPTARAEDGPDLGGGHFPQLVSPRVGVWTGTPVSPSHYGALWHLLDEGMGLRFSGLDLARFAATDLARYNVLIFPPVLEAGGEAYRHLLGKDGLDRLRRWIEAGGTAIGIGPGARFLADKELGLTKARVRSQVLDRYPPVVLGLGPEEAELAGRFRAVGLRAPRPEKDEEDEEDENKEGPKEERPARSSPYDVAPILGPGAVPFAVGFSQGTPATGPPVSLKDWLAPLLPPGQEEPKEEDLTGAEERLRRFAPRGTFLRVELDPELWLAWGLPRVVDALVGSAATALVADAPVDVPARFADLDALHLGGLLWPEAAGVLARTAYLTREPVGRGQVVLFADEPNFRAWTLGTRRLLLNAILYGPGLGTQWSTPW